MSSHLSQPRFCIGFGEQRSRIGLHQRSRNSHAHSLHLSAAIGKPAKIFVVEIGFFLISVGCHKEKAHAEMLIIGLSWRGRLPGFGGGGIDVFWMGYREGFQQGSRSVCLNVALLIGSDLGRK